MSLLSDADKARELHLDIEKNNKFSTYTEIELAHLLYSIKKNNLYKKAVGEGINTWVDYLKQPEVNITQHRANKLVRIWDYFVKVSNHGTNNVNIADVPLYALDYAARKELMDVQKANQLFDEARVLSEKDWKDRYHDEVEATERTYTYLVMRKCVQTGNMTKVHGISSEDITRSFPDKCSTS